MVRVRAHRFAGRRGPVPGLPDPGLPEAPSGCRGSVTDAPRMADVKLGH
jgi:hypothetical protein